PIRGARTISGATRSFQLTASSSQSPVASFQLPVSSLRLWEDEAESGPAARSRLDLDFAVVELDDTIDHREADARAPLLGREVEVEDLPEVLGWNADAGVFHVD